MHAFARGLSVLAALVMICCGVLGLIATREQFAPCDGVPQSAAACLEAMDGPVSFYGTLPPLWITALAAAAIVVAFTILGWLSGTPTKGLAWSALVLVFVFNTVVEYVIWLGVAGGHWDVPPGTGTTQSIAFIIAGSLVLLAAVLAKKAPASAQPGVQVTPSAA